MKVVILAGWLWTRLAEETWLRPKPMVEIWWMPVLWHIMKTYNHYWYNEFIIALWYKWSYIKELRQVYSCQKERLFFYKSEN